MDRGDERVEEMRTLGDGTDEKAGRQKVWEMRKVADEKGGR